MSEFLFYCMVYCVWCFEWGSIKEDGMWVDVFSFEFVVVKWVEWDDVDSVDYLIVCGNDVIVLVVEDYDGVQEYCFIVSGELCFVYWVCQII